MGKGSSARPGVKGDPLSGPESAGGADAPGEGVAAPEAATGPPIPAGECEGSCDFLDDGGVEHVHDQVWEGFAWDQGIANLLELIDQWCDGPQPSPVSLGGELARFVTQHNFPDPVAATTIAGFLEADLRRRSDLHRLECVAHAAGIDLTRVTGRGGGPGVVAIDPTVWYERYDGPVPMRDCRR